MSFTYDPSALRYLVAEIDRLLFSPGESFALYRVRALALYATGRAPNGFVSGLALRVAAAAGLLDRFPDVPEYLSALHQAVEKLARASSSTDAALHHGTAAPP